MAANEKYITSSEQTFVNGDGVNSAQQKGSGAKASGRGSMAEGSGTTASGSCSHAEGSITTANGDYSHAEGYGTTASGFNSHAEGCNTTASGHYSHAEGCHTTAKNMSEHSGGNRNISNKISSTFGSSGNTTFSHGIGTSSADTKNAIEIMENGDAYLYGVGGYDGTNATATTSQTLQSLTISYITQYDKDGEIVSFSTINDVYNWIRYCKIAEQSLYNSQETAPHFAKCLDGKTYQLTSNVPEYESLVDPNRKVKVKQPAFHGKVIAKRVIPITAAPGSVYLVYYGSNQDWLPLRLGTRAHIGTTYILNDASLDSKAFNGRWCFLNKFCMDGISIDSSTNSVWAKANHNKGHHVFPVQLDGNRFSVTDIYYQIKILKPLVDVDNVIHLSSEYISISKLPNSASLETTCKLKYYNLKLHYDEPSLFLGKSFVEGNKDSINFGQSFANCEVHTLKRTSRAKTLTFVDDKPNPLYANHCIFDAKISGDKLIIYRREETRIARPFSGVITITTSNYQFISLIYTGITDKVWEESLPALGYDTLTIALMKRIVRVTAQVSGESPRHFYGITEFKPNSKRVSRGYKKLGSAKRRTINTKRPDNIPEKKSGKYLYYKKYRGIKSPIPAVIHVFPNFIRKADWPR